MRKEYFDKERTVATILFFAEKAGGTIDLWRLLKLIYVADRKHLNKKGHTITRDIYGKLPAGATPSATYDLLKEARGEKTPTRHDLRDFITQYIIVQPDPDNVVIARQSPNLEDLSPAEIETLEDVWNTLGRASFGVLWEEAHDQAYKDKEPNDNWISYEAMAETEELKTYLRDRASDFLLP